MAIKPVLPCTMISKEMVVPVPVVLKKSDIHVIEPGLFQVLNDYSAPRLVEYYDQNPCNTYGYNEDRTYKKELSGALSEVTVTAMGREEKEE